jgi:hypothetical protein
MVVNPSTQSRLRSGISRILVAPLSTKVGSNKILCEIIPVIHYMQDLVKEAFSLFDSHEICLIWHICVDKNLCQIMNISKGVACNSPSEHS